MSAVSEESLRFNAENATTLASDFLKRLGYKRGLVALKVSLTEETYIVEMGLERKTAKVQIDSKTKEIKEYEIQDAENQSGSSLLKGKPILLLISIIAIAVVALKLLNVF